MDDLGLVITCYPRRILVMMNRMICTEMRFRIRQITAEGSEPCPNFWHEETFALLPGVFNTLCIMVELTASFITECLVSDSDAVRSVAQTATLNFRMVSPLRHNAHFCCSRYAMLLS